MPQTEVAPAGLDMAEFETAFKASVPCMNCERPARFRSLGHQVNDCGLPDLPPFYKCLDCYVKWRCDIMAVLQTYGVVCCWACGRSCYTCEELSDYREF